MNAWLRRCYDLALFLITPVLLAHLLYKSRAHPGYRRRWHERFARYREAAATDGILVHAVSVGEFNCALPLIRGLRRRLPYLPITVTTTTPTGSERVRAALGDSVQHLYLPLDLPSMIRRFYDHLQPRLVIVMETEVWPNLFLEAERRGVPLMLANARLSARSGRRYLGFRPLARQVLGTVDAVAAQSATDAERLMACGAVGERVRVLGNLKFAIDRQPAAIPPTAFLGEHRPVWVAGSSHDSEEPALLAAHRRLLKHHPRALLILAPRHPDRLARVEQHVAAARLGWRRLSQSASSAVTEPVLIIDELGHLPGWYARADFAFVGGTLAPIGGHNPIEPAAVGCPVLVGPHCQNIQGTVALLAGAGACWRVGDPAEVSTAVAALADDPARRRAMATAGRDLVDRHRSVLTASLDWAQALLGAPGTV